MGFSAKAKATRLPIAMPGFSMSAYIAVATAREAIGAKTSGGTKPVTLTSP